MTEATAAPSEQGERRAWGWVAHLRAGGTTPWLEWHDMADSRGRYLPGAQQLELLRRLNLVGRPAPALADSVLAASAAGRGRPDLELVGSVPSASSFGPAPVDPSVLPAGELMRVAASVLADELAAAGLPEAGPTRRWPWRSWWQRGYRLVGDPELADGLRAQLVARGRPPGGREPRIVVLGADLATMAAHAWTHRAFGEGVASWREWLRLVRERAELPARVDLSQVARRWAARVGEPRVHVVLDTRLVAALVGERRSLAPPSSVPGECGELARRVGAVLGLLVPPEERAALMRARLRPRLEAASARPGFGRPLVVPPSHWEWFEARAGQMRRDVERSGYAVHGDLDALVPRWPDDHDPAHSGPSPEATLDLAVRVLLDPGDGSVDDGRTA